ncbi:hypothetical protein GW846_00640 [Candidatus Gracilibacteria bacterium]|nr:hypothetical protein [Candidatus Gracilibacteria bacterium]
MKNIDALSLPEMKVLLGNLKTYSDMSKKLGHRGRDLFQRQITGSKNFVVEYFPAFGEDAAWEQAQVVFKKSFNSSPKREEVQFEAKESMKGGMKVFVDDNMVDISFTKVERLLQK